jgi:hypothetical protein
MSSLATPWLDLTVACQRHTHKRTTYLTARPPFDPSRFGVEPVDTADARTFIETHHYSGTFPVEIGSYGLFESKPNARATLVGVAVFSIPVNTPAALTALLEPGQTVCDLGRFILNDHILANAETWFLTRAYRALRQDKTLADGRTPRFPFSTSYSDPCPRASFDRIIFPGHVGIVYQAKNACYTGRSRARSLCLTRSGAVLSDRALSKLRADDNDARHVYARLREHGAPALKIGESGACYLARALIEGPFRRVRHRGNHRYVLLPSCPSLRRKILATFPRLPYPKRTDPLPDEAGPLDTPSSADEASDHPDATVEMGVAA